MWLMWPQLRLQRHQKPWCRSMGCGPGPNEKFGFSHYDEICF